MILKVNSLIIINENSALYLFSNEKSKVKVFKDKNVTGFSMHLIPRTTLTLKNGYRQILQRYKAVLS